MEVTRLSLDLQTYLDGNYQKVLTVHSAFPSAVNLVDQEGNLATLLVEKNLGAPAVASKNNIGPMGALVRMSPWELDGVCVGDGVLIEKGGLAFQGRDLFLSLEGASLWDPGAEIDGTVNDLYVQLALLDVIRDVIISETFGKGTFNKGPHNSESGSNGIGALINQFDFDDLEGWILPESGVSADVGVLNPYCQFIRETLGKLLEALIRKDFDGFIGLLPKFVGFGPGLTPATDDFLAGVMIAMYYDGATGGRGLEATRERLWRIYQGALGLTTLVSENMLRATALGQVSEAHRDLVRGLFFKSSEGIEKAAESVAKLAELVAKHGASSGVDFLFGFYCMNKIRVTQSVRETLTHD